MNLTSLKDVLAQRDLADSEIEKAIFTFPDGKQFVFLMQETSYKLILEGMSTRGLHEFFNKLGIDQPAHWIEDNAFSIEDSELETEEEGNMVESWPEAVASFSHRRLYKLLTKLYGLLENLSTPKKSVPGDAWVQAMPKTPKSVSPSKTGTQIPFIPNLSSSSASFTVNVVK